MQYTNYFKRIVDAHGIPPMTVDDHKKFLNILSLEIRIQELQRLKKLSNQPNINSRLLKIEKELTALTGNHSARDVLNSMLEPKPKWGKKLDLE